MTDYTREPAELRSRMLAAAEVAVVVADHSKFGRMTPVRVANFEQVQYLVTDRRPPADINRALHAKRIRIVIAA